MPNTNEYHLYIHVDEKEKETESPVSNSSAEKKKDNAITKDAAQKVGAAVAIYKTAKGFAQQLITHQVSTIELRTGASEYQQKMQFMYNIGNSALGILESIALGAAVGGGAPGALVGALVGIAGQAISYAQAQNVIDLNRTLESMTITQNNVRAGTANRRLYY